MPPSLPDPEPPLGVPRLIVSIRPLTDEDMPDTSKWPGEPLQKPDDVPDDIWEESEAPWKTTGLVYVLRNGPVDEQYVTAEAPATLAPGMRVRIDSPHEARALQRVSVSAGVTTERPLLRWCARLVAD